MVLKLTFSLIQILDNILDYIMDKENIYYGQGKLVRDTVFDVLADTCLHSWHSLYMDNFYNSVELSEELLVIKVHSVGMLRSQQEEPSNI